MFDAELVHRVLRAVPDAIIDGGWGVDALVGCQTRAHDDLDLVIRSERADPVVDKLGALGFTRLVDERPARIVASRDDDGCHVDLHLVESTASGTTQRLPGGRQFTYVLSGGTGVIDGKWVRCLSPEMQLLTHAGYEPDDDDRGDVALVAAVSGLALPPPYARPLRADEAVEVRDATVADVPAACIVRVRSWRAAYVGLMPQPVIDALDLGTMWTTWRASVKVPSTPVTRLFVAGRPGEVHAYSWVRPAEEEKNAAEIGAIYSDPSAWGTGAGWAAFSRAVDFLRVRGCTDLSLWMLKGNDRAGRFYERAGWRPDGAEKTTATPAGSYVEVRYRPVES